MPIPMENVIWITQVTGKKELLKFIEFPWKVYEGDPKWVPPLISDQKKQLGPTYPFWQHAKGAIFLAERNGKAVGRIAAFLDRNFVETFGEKTGFFGYFECLNDARIAGALLKRVMRWGRGQGLEKMIGPISPSTNDVLGLLVEGFNGSPPRIMMPYNPPYYVDLMKKLELREVQTLLAYEMPILRKNFARLEERAKKLREKEIKGLALRHFNLKDFRAEVARLREVYNDAWVGHWGFVPWEEEELWTIAKGLKSFLVPELTACAEIQGEPVGVLIAVPDYNQALKQMNGRITSSALYKFLFHKWDIKDIRLMILGVKKEYQKRGLDALMYLKVFQKALELGYEGGRCEFSWILGTNLLTRRAATRIGGEISKKYKIYELTTKIYQMV